MTPFDPSAPVVVAEVRQYTNRAEEVLYTLKAMDRQSAVSDFEMADLWSEADQGEYYRSTGADTLADFIKENGFSLSPREIAYRINISRKSKRIGATVEQRIKAKISKMKAICELNPDLVYTDPDTGAQHKLSDVMMTLVIDAAHQSLDYIKDQVKKYKGATEGDDSVIEWFNLPSFKSRNDFYKETIEVAKRLSGDTVGDDKQARDISTATAVERIFAEARGGFDIEAGGGTTEATGEFSDEAYIEDESGSQFEVAG